MSFYKTTDSPPHFDRVAWFYDTLAQIVFGKAQLRAQAHFLDYIPENARILLVGGGSGWLLEQVLLKKPNSPILYLEASAKMLALAQRRVAKLSPTTVEWRLGTENDLLPSERFDVLITPFVLDLFSRQQLLHRILPALLKNLAPEGIWLFTDFVKPKNWWQVLLEKAMFAFFRPLTDISATQLSDFKPIFKHFHYHYIASTLFFRGFIETAVLIRKQDIMS